MYDFDSESSNPTTDDTTKVDVFTYGYAISTILTLGNSIIVKLIRFSTCEANNNHFWMLQIYPVFITYTII